MVNTASVIKEKRMVETEVEIGITLILTFDQAEILYGIISQANGANLPQLYYPLQEALGSRANSSLVKATIRHTSIDPYQAEKESGKFPF